MRDGLLRTLGSSMAAGDKPEVAVYRSEGHGFADNVKRGGSTSDDWVQEFFGWLQTAGFAREK